MDWITKMPFNDRKERSVYVGFALTFLIIGVVLDYHIFSTMTLILVYIPFMVMVGFLSESYRTVAILSGIIVTILYINSPHIWTFEIFLLRWLAYFSIAFIVKYLKDNIKKERENLLNFTSTLAQAIDARDPYTSFHSQNVAYYAREIAKAMNLSEQQCEDIYVGGLLHDVGKIGVPEAILNKPSRLTVEEFEQIKKHPQIGFEMLQYIPHFKGNGVLDMVLYHHEKFDGAGYPHGLKGEEIPLTARIIAVADAFDAMTSRRIYRTKHDLDYALHEIKSGKGTQFDPEVAEVFLQLASKQALLEKVNHLNGYRDSV